MADYIRITNKWRHWFYVMPEFIKIVPKYKTISAMSLIYDYKIIDYLHNPEGPAMEERIFGFFIPQYYLKGKKVSQEQHAAAQFHTKLEDLLNE